VEALEALPQPLERLMRLIPLVGVEVVVVEQLVIKVVKEVLVLLLFATK
jgi:hypothetical protein